MSVYLPHVKLANVRTGQAEVRWFTPAAPDVPFGFSRSLGWVTRNYPGGRWLVRDDKGAPLEAFPSRQAAVDYLVANRAVDQVSS
jgi:hypothetical protein